MKITLYLMSAGTSFDKTALRQDSGFTEVPVSKLGDTSCKLFVKSGQPTEPKWVAELRSLTGNPQDIGTLRNQSSSAVLLLQQGDRVFALTYGYAFQAFESSKLERGFGLKVTANSVKRGQVKSADTRALNRDGRSQKVILPAPSELADLGIELNEDWVKQLSGRVDTIDFASAAAGADSLKLSIADFKLKDLPTKLAQVTGFFESDSYKQDFGFIDNLVRLDAKDSIVADLDKRVTEMVLRSDQDIYFAAPDPFEQLDVDHFQLAYRSKAQLEDLGRDAVYAALAELKVPTDDPLRRVHIEAFDADGKRIDRRYRLYDYVQAELEEADSRYVLSAGVWFQVSKSYVETVRRRVAELTDLTEALDLPTWGRTPDGKQLEEGDYNAAVAAARPYALLDKQNLHFDQYRKVEVCDLLTPERELLCVKRATKSATLSHLFAQGSVSAALMHEAQYQGKLMAAHASVGGSTEWPGAEAWTVVYAIGTSKPGPLAESLFFFSQINLLTNVEDIRSRNIRVAVARIELA